MAVVKYILTSIFAILGLFLTVMVILQEGKSAGLGTIGGMAESYWEKNKARSVEGKLEKYTKYVAIGFFVIAILLTCGFWY